jgi:DNA polymerase-3 subunit beta
MLTAICLDISGDVLTLAATDRYRLAAREVSFTPAEPDLREIALIPARFMVEAARAFVPGVPVTMAFGSDAGQGDPARTAAPGGAPAQPRPAEGLACFESGDRRLTGRLIAGEFIRYRNRFGDEFGCQADLPAGPLIEAVRRAALVAERAGPVRLSFRPDQVVIEAHAEGRARAAETVTADFAGAEPVISFNPHYLLDGLTAAAGSGPARQPADTEATPAQAAATAAIRLEFTSPAKPALITSAGKGGGEDGEAGPAPGPSFRYLVVPLRSPTRA